MKEQKSVIFNVLFHRPCVSTADEMDFDPRDMIIIPPPDLYADVTVE